VREIPGVKGEVGVAERCLSFGLRNSFRLFYSRWFGCQSVGCATRLSESRFSASIRNRNRCRNGPPASCLGNGRSNKVNLTEQIQTEARAGRPLKGSDVLAEAFSKPGFLAPEAAALLATGGLTRRGAGRRGQ